MAVSLLTTTIFMRYSQRLIYMSITHNRAEYYRIKKNNRLFVGKALAGYRRRRGCDDKGAVVDREHGVPHPENVMRMNGAEYNSAIAQTVAAEGADKGDSPILSAGQHEANIFRQGGDDDQQLAVISREAEDYGVYHLRRNKDRDDGVEGVLQPAVDYRGQRDDNGVADKDDIAHADIREFSVKAARDYIGAAGAASSKKYQPQTEAGEYPPEDRGYYQIAVIESSDKGECVDKNGRERYCKDCTHDKAHTQPDSSPNEQRDVQQKRYRSYRSREKVIEHRGDTGNASGGDIVRRGKKTDRQRVYSGSGGDHREVCRIHPGFVGQFHIITPLIKMSLRGIEDAVAIPLI